MTVAVDEWRLQTVGRLWNLPTPCPLPAKPVVGRYLVGIGLIYNMTALASTVEPESQQHRDSNPRQSGPNGMFRRIGRSPT